MCLILFALRQHPDYPLIVIANRDEYYARPTRSAHWWEDSAGIFAGRDLQAQGTWLGVNRNGRFAAVTNVREPESMAPGKLSRGNLPREFLAGDEPPESFLTRIKPDADAYAGFNLLIGDSNGLYFYSNRQTEVTPVPAGIYGISNGLFDEAWPKLTSGKQVLVCGWCRCQQRLRFLQVAQPVVNGGGQGGGPGAASNFGDLQELFAVVLGDQSGKGSEDTQQPSCLV